MFVDSEPQPNYIPPPLGDRPDLEAELARSEEFIAGLQDDHFALTAFFRLAYGEWIKVGYRDFDTFNSNGSVAHMIAGLRGKGENYLDIEFQTLSGREQPLKLGNSPHYAQLVQAQLRKIGWRTHTAEEIQAIFREDLRKRLKARVELLRRIKILETRPMGQYEHWVDRPLCGAYPLDIYENDDPAWFTDFNTEEKEASSGELSLRLFALANYAQINRKEYDELKGKLNLGPLAL